jgi:cytochrome c oxidase assembly protein subunit 19
MGGPMSGSKAPLAPEKGVFPLDHFGECKRVMRAYLGCLKSRGDDAARCRYLSKKYLECRMERELMAKQPLEELGFSDTSKGVGVGAKTRERGCSWRRRRRETEARGGLRRGRSIGESVQCESIVT